MTKLILDSDVLIEIVEKKSRMKTVFERIEELNVFNFFISSVVYCELIAGTRDTKHLKIIEDHLKQYTILHVNENISEMMIQFMCRFKLKHHSKINDLLIGSTSIYYNIPLYTFNKKDFDYLPGINLI